MGSSKDLARPADQPIDPLAVTGVGALRYHEFGILPQGNPPPESPHFFWHQIGLAYPLTVAWRGRTRRRRKGDRRRWGYGLLEW